MPALTEGDIVVLQSGSPKFMVEKLEGRLIHCVWCHDGQINRDVFDARLLRKWTDSHDERSDRGGRFGGGGGGDRDRRGGGDRDRRGGGDRDRHGGDRKGGRPFHKDR